MNILWIDYETFYAPDYKLKNRSSGLIRTEYINDPRFKAHGAAVTLNDHDFEWVTGKDLPQFFGDCKHMFDAMCCFNGLFDHGITQRYYLKDEKFLLDAASMARGVLSTQHPEVGGSLDAIAKFLFPDRPEFHKQHGVLETTLGIRDLPPQMEANLAGYGKQDGVVLRAMFKELLKFEYPWDTALVDIHLTLAMGVYPQLQMNSLKAAGVHAEEVRIKERIARELGVDRKTLRSAEAFADMLRAQGVEPPTKISPKTGQVAYAFAAKDEDFKALLEHENPAVQFLVESRMGEKAAQVESRAKLFARLPRDLPIPLGYAKAHTGRHGGEEYNMQNLGRGSALRDCVEAPKGKKVLVRDLKQIELRMNAWWCGERWLVDLLRAGGDPYCMLATKIFGREITKADELERFVGKQGELSCGYGSGDVKILMSLKANGVKEATPQLAKSVKVGYRSSHPAIVGTWEWLQKVAIPVVAGVTGGTVERRGVVFMPGRIVLPSGRSVWYPDMHVNSEGDWVYRVNKQRNKGQDWKKLFGGAFLENIIQALSYDVFMFHARIAWREYGLRLAMAVHDEMNFVVEDERIEWANEVVTKIQTMTPDWCTDLPLGGEGSWGQTYLEAK